MNKIDFTDMLISNFPDFIRAFDQYCPFKKPGQLRNHLTTIGRLRELGSPTAALDDQTFLQNLYDTLLAWGIGARGSKLKPYSAFVIALKAKADEIAGLSRIAIDQDIDVEAVAPRLGRLIKTLDVVENETKMVAGSKTLHHLLPDLVPPMDRQYTQKFFGWDDGRFQHLPEECVTDALRGFVEMAQAANPSQYVKDHCWHSSRTKVLDNAIIGWWCLLKQNFKMHGSETESGPEIAS